MSPISESEKLQRAFEPDPHRGFEFSRVAPVGAFAPVGACEF